MSSLCWPFRLLSCLQVNTKLMFILFILRRAPNRLFGMRLQSGIKPPKNTSLLKLLVQLNPNSTPPLVCSVCPKFKYLFFFFYSLRMFRVEGFSFFASLCHIQNLSSLTSRSPTFHIIQKPIIINSTSTACVSALLIVASLLQPSLRGKQALCAA